MGTPRDGYSTTRLAEPGHVLVAGGYALSTTEIYNHPMQGSWSSSGPIGASSSRTCHPVGRWARPRGGR